MAAMRGFGNHTSIPRPIAIGLIAVALAVSGMIGWKLLAPPPDPTAGMSEEQQKAEIQRRVRQTGQKILTDRLLGSKAGLSGATK